MRILITILLLAAVSMLAASIEIESRNGNSLIIVFSNQDYSILEGEEFSYIDKDWTRSEQAGQPDLPYRNFNFAVPPGGDLDYEIIDQQIREIRLGRQIVPVAEIVETGKTHEFLYKPEPDSYLETRSDPVLAKDKYRYRFYELVPLEFHPFIYDHRSLTLKIYERIRIRIDIRGNHDFRSLLPEVYPEIMEQFISNYDQGKNWKTLPDKEFIRMPFERSEFWYEIESWEPGNYFLGYDALRKLPGYCDPQSLRLLQMVREPGAERGYRVSEIPLFVESDSQSGFNREDRVYFSLDPAQLIDPVFGHKLWLTFGGRFQDSPLRSVEIPEGEITELDKIMEKGSSQPPTREEINILMIHPAEFLSQTQELAQIQFDNYNLQSHLADQQEIFNVFSGGLPDAEAIRDSIESCWLLHPELEYVILVGSGTSDWNNPTEKNRIMVLSGSNNDILGDDNFVVFGGSNRPELSISRLPAQNQSDLDFLIDRIRNYIETPELGWWRNQILIIPDDENKSGGFEGTDIYSGLNHTKKAEDTARIINRGAYVDKLYTIEYDLDPYQNKPDATEELIRRINEGRMIWYYIGHGDPDVLGDEEYFKTSQDLGFLTNSERLTLFLAASCSVGRFDEAGYDCTAELMLLHQEGGSIASIAATRSCGPDNNYLLMLGLLDELVNVRNNVGRSLFSAILNSGTSIYTATLYNLLGHPLLETNPPESNLIISDVPDSLQARQTVEVEGYFSESDINSQDARMMVFDADNYNFYFNQLNDQTYAIGYKEIGHTFFNGYTQVENGYYNGSYIVPDDIKDYVEIESILDFYYQSEVVEKGFIIEGDVRNLVNINYDIRIVSPAGEQFTWVQTADFDGENTTIILRHSISDADYGLENLRVFVDTSGRIICYAQYNGREYTSYYDPILYDATPVDAENNDAPQIDLMLDSRSFKNGDYVTTAPLLIADIEDDNGINILGTPGHRILAIVDNDEIRIDVTDGFVYDLNSHTRGELTWQLPELSEGNHILQLLVFDNFNTPAFETVDFIARKAGKVSIEKMLPYPNPISRDGHFTFIITEPADITLTIYTMTGRKIRTIRKPGCEAGYNQIYWNGKDQDGDELANNTYFWKIKAKQLGNGKITEEIGTFIIFK